MYWRYDESMANNLEQLIESLRAGKVLRTPAIIDAFRSIRRADFVLTQYQAQAYADEPLPIGSGQTISQPYTVAFMLELLDPQPGERLLDVGAGSGWTTALLAFIAGPTGMVFGVELQPDLVALGQENLAKYAALRATILPAGATYGLPEAAPFDRILVSAANDTLPSTLVEQLRHGGVMVIPIQDAIWRVTRVGDTAVEIDRHEGFAFVPLLSRASALNTH